MFNCKSLLYHPAKQEAITPIPANLLVKWDVADSPRIITQQTVQQQVPCHWYTIPPATLLPDLERLAIACSGIHQSYIDFYSWTDLHLIDSITVPHATYQEIDDDDPFCTHDTATKLSHLSVTPCGTYLVVIEEYGDIHLLHLATKTWTRLQRRIFADYSEMIAFDRTMKFMAIEFLDTDAVYELYRIDRLETDLLTHLGRFEGVGGCHRGQLQFNPLADAIVRTGYRCNIDYYIFDSQELADVVVPTDTPSNATTPYLTKQWTLSLPYLQHPHSLHHPWQSCVVFQAADRLIFGAGEAIVQIDTLEGKIVGEYHTAAIVNAIAFDATNQRVIAATTAGVIAISLTEFDPDLAYLQSIQAAPTIKKIPDPSIPADMPQGSATSIFSIIFFGIISICCLGMILGPFFLLAIFTFGDNPFPDPVVDRSYPLGENRIREKVYPTGMNWPDQKYEHIYSLEHKNGSIEVDRFTNEERQGGGTKTKPKLVGEWLAIFSTSRTFLWKSGSKPIEFYPYQVAGWDDYVIRDLHDYSSYHAKDFIIEGNRWIIEYQCENLPCPQMQDNRIPPTNIRFFSDDFGKTFQILKDADKSKILKKRH
jgi:hypothetical protein